MTAKMAWMFYLEQRKKRCNFNWLGHLDSNQD
jgi:hypothetical protein